MKKRRKNKNKSVSDDTVSVSKTSIEELKNNIQNSFDSVKNIDDIKKNVDTAINNFTENLSPSVKKLNLKKLYNAFLISIDGLKYAYCNESSLIVLTIFDILFILGGIICKISRIEWIFIVIMITTSFAAELLNTAIEKTVDLVTDKYHPLAKIAKDTGSAAEFVYVVMLFSMAALIFIPHILEMFNLI